MKRRLDISLIIDMLKQVFEREKGPISLYEPTFLGNEWSYVNECLDTGWVSSAGKYVNQFEHLLAEFTEIPYAIATVNGTAALHLGLLLVGVRHNEEVLVPSLTFIATANAVSYCGAIPHFVDSTKETLGIDSLKLRSYLGEISEIRAGGCYNKQTGRRIAAIVPVHTFGHPVEIEPVIELCQDYSIKLVEDAAESLGSRYKGQHTGTWGEVSAISFNGNKIVTTGGGGALLTHDPEVARQAKHLTTTAKLPHPWAYEHDQVGYNYRMPNLNAALGCAQLEQLPELLNRKRKLAMLYKEKFRAVDGVCFFEEKENTLSNYWLNVLLLDEDHAEERNELLERALRVGIQMRPAWTPVHQLKPYQDCPRMDLSVAENLASRIVNLPSSPKLW